MFVEASLVLGEKERGDNGAGDVSGGVVGSGGKRREALPWVFTGTY